MKNYLKSWFLSFFPKKYHALPDGTNIDWKTFEKRINYRVKNRDIFLEALRHRSHPSCSAPDFQMSNERLEFLGDAVANFFVGEFVFNEFPESPEGDLTKMRSTLVSREYMAKKGHELKIGDFIALGEGEERSGGRNKDSILSNTLEAILGAIYFDGGQEAVQRFLKHSILSDFGRILKTEGANYKGDLLEYLQKKHIPSPQYVTRKESGPDHRRVYTVAVKAGRKILGVGKGKSKKIAEQAAAKHALNKINSQSD